MSAAFDPYHKWLGILPKDQPPHHYRLLGVELFEADVDVIEAAADRQLAFLRKYQSGEHAEDCRRLLNEVSRARLCLVKPATKVAYDLELRAQLHEPVPALSLDGDASRPTPGRKNGLLVPGIAGAVVVLLVIVGIIASRGNKEGQNAAGAPDERKIEQAVANIAKPKPKGEKAKPKPAGPGETDILPLLTQEQVTKGRWKTEAGVVESLGPQPQAQLALPVRVPLEYTLHIEATRLESPDQNYTVGCGLVCGANNCMFVMAGGTSGLQILDRREWENNETSVPDIVPAVNKPFQLDAIVRDGNIEVRYDGRTILDWYGDFSRLQRKFDWNESEPEQLYLGTENSYRFTKVTLGPPLPRQKLPGSDLQPGQSVELLDLVDLQRDTWRGAWLKGNRSLKSDPSVEAMHFSVPFQVPSEYKLTADVEPYLERKEIFLGLPFPQGEAGVVLGGGTGEVSGLYLDGRQYHDYIGVTRRSADIPAGRFKLTAVVRKNWLVVKVGETTVFDWKGDPRRFEIPPFYGSPGRRIAAGTWLSGYRFYSLKLTRLAETEQTLPQPTAPKDGDLLAIVDLDRDTRQGAWQVQGPALQSVAGLGTSSLIFPARLPANYEFRVVLERRAHKDGMWLVIPVAKQAVTMVLDGVNGTASGIQWYLGRAAHDNPTTIHTPSFLFPQGKPRVLRGQVTDKHLLVELDAKKLWDLDITDKLIDPAEEMRPGWLTPEERLQMYIATWKSEFVIYDARFRTLDQNSAPLPALDMELINKASAANQTATTAPSSNPSTVPKPSTSRVLVGDGLLTTGTTPVPDAAAQDAASQKIRQLFAADFAKAKKEPEKLSLAARLEQLADDTNDDMAIKYVGFDEARKLAMEAGDLSKCVGLVNALCIEFKIDHSELKFATFKGIAPNLKSQLLNRALAEAALPLVDRFMQAGNYSSAADVAAIAVQAATRAKDKPLQTDAQEARKESQALADEFSDAQKAETTLKTTPDDHAARLVWGRWLCLNQNNWSDGLKVLQRCGDETLQGLAERDLRGPNETEALKLGKDWLEYAKGESDHRHAAFATRALHWLEQAHARTERLAKFEIEQFIEEAVKIRDWNSPLPALLTLIEPKVVQRKFTPSEESNHRGGEPFQDVSTNRGILIGFNCSIGAWDQYTVFRGIQPVYATKLGVRTGKWYGSSDGELVELRARSGYAISGIRSQSGGAFDNLQVAFSRITKTGLDPKRSYRSPLINGPELEVLPQTVTHPGSQPCVGIFGHSDTLLRGLGLLIVR